MVVLLACVEWCDRDGGMHTDRVVCVCALVAMRCGSRDLGSQKVSNALGYGCGGVGWLCLRVAWLCCWYGLSGVAEMVACILTVLYLCVRARGDVLWLWWILAREYLACVWLWWSWLVGCGCLLHAGAVGMG